MTAARTYLPVPSLRIRALEVTEDLTSDGIMEAFGIPTPKRPRHSIFHVGLVNPLVRILWVERSRSWCDLHVGDYIAEEPDGNGGFYPIQREIFEARWMLEPETDTVTLPRSEVDRLRAFERDAVARSTPGHAVVVPAS